jgi:hypothetical protein
VKRILIGAGVFFALAAPAQAATLVNGGGVLTYTSDGDGGEVTVRDGQGFVYVTRGATSNPWAIQVYGCEILSSNQFRCSGVTSVVVEGGSGADHVHTQRLETPAALNGGSGDDLFYADAGDTVSGGPGVDSAHFGSETVAGAFSLDGVADDGFAGRPPMNLLPDIEDVWVVDPLTDCVGSCPPSVPTGSLTLVGGATGNRLTGASGNDTIAGGGGSDRLQGFGGDDTLNARDGVADRVECGPGTDTAIVDQLDQVIACENVDRAEVGYGLEDKPPTIAWAGASAFAVNASDDRGVAKVELLLDGRTLCTDTVAPYECSFTPTVALVGRHTVVALATDSIGQTSSVVRSFSVPRYKPTAVTLNVRGRTASGKVTLPAGVPCSGKVQVGGKTTSLRKDCSYRVTVKRAKSYVTKYLGTKGIAPKRSKRVRA